MRLREVYGELRTHLEEIRVTGSMVVTAFLMFDGLGIPEGLP
jgi:hypothetical protein